MKVLVTGGCGFIGSHFIRLLLKHWGAIQVRNIDKLTYAGNPDNLKDVKDHPRYDFSCGSIENEAFIDHKFQHEKYDVVVNFAAESHVDRSLHGSLQFVETNLKGTTVLLTAARKYKVGRFVQVSTDEVYGSSGDGAPFLEDASLNPGNPYSVTKAAADMMVQAHARSFGLNTVITRSANNYGPFQFPEKFVPVVISKVLKNEKIPVYGKGLQIRDWLHVEDNCNGIFAAMERGRAGEIYNLPGGHERPNIEVAKEILRFLGKDGSLIQYVEDRPGHDWRYSIDGGKAKRELGWTSKRDLKGGLAQTIEWYRDNKEWVEASLKRK